MKWAIGTIGLVGGAAVLVAFLTLDAPSAAFFTFATLLVIALGSAPVVLGVVTRTAPGRARRRPPSTVVRTDAPETSEPEVRPSRPRRGRERAHRRPRG